MSLAGWGEIVLPLGPVVTLTTRPPERLFHPVFESHDAVAHKFQIAETVLLTLRNRNVPGGVYEITKLFPHNGSELEYRIKSAAEEFEQVARESKLTKA